MILKRARIAIDGPAGAGKSTISKMLARAMGYEYIDTGAMYRTIAFAAACSAIAQDDEAAIQAFLPTLMLDFKPHEGEFRIFLQGKEIKEEIRTPAIAMAASGISKMPSVRAYLLDLQRNLAARGGVVLEGRDIGSVVLPDAEIKFFLDASPEERARRRYFELQAKGIQTSLAEVQADILQRDEQDRTRAQAPLCVAQGAHQIDTTGLTPLEIVEAMTSTANRLGFPKP